MKVIPFGVLERLRKVKGDENTTGLMIKPLKCHLYTRDKTIANQCREILSNKFSDLTVHSNMDKNRLNTPVGSDEWVWSQLEEVLVELESTIKKIAEMPYKMEAFTLSRNCMTQCRVMHFMRIVLPRQLYKVLTRFSKKDSKSLLGLG